MFVYLDPLLELVAVLSATRCCRGRAGQASGIRHPEGGNWMMVLKTSPFSITGKLCVADEQQMERRTCQT